MWGSCSCPEPVNTSASYAWRNILRLCPWFTIFIYLPVVIDIFNTMIDIPQGKFDINSYQPFRVNGIFTFTYSPPVVDSPPGPVRQTRLHLFDRDLSNSRIEELRYQVPGIKYEPTVSDVARSNSSKCVPRSRKRQRGDIISSIHLYGRYEITYRYVINQYLMLNRGRLF